MISPWSGYTVPTTQVYHGPPGTEVLIYGGFLYGKLEPITRYEHSRIHSGAEQPPLKRTQGRLQRLHGPLRQIRREIQHPRHSRHHRPPAQKASRL